MDQPGHPANTSAAHPPTRLRYEDVRVRDADIRVFDRSHDPDDGDVSDMYVIDVFGASILVRLRTPRGGGEPELYVHIDNEGHPPIDLAVEVDNRGEHRYRI